MLTSDPVLEADFANLRKRIAREAASFLYLGIEKEFKQAKLKAAETYNSSFLPSNLEVALELDKIAEEREGPARKERLVKMREEALSLMSFLGSFQPRLVGSVWRGTTHRDSDIDIVVFHDDPQVIMNILKQHNIEISHAEWVEVTKKGKRKGAFHIYAESPHHEDIEIKVTTTEHAGVTEQCEIYGDRIVGLTVSKLSRVLKESPAQRFLPV